MLRAVAQRVVLLLAAALLGTLAAAAPTHGLEVYVSPSGSDERGVGSATAPFASIDRAVAALPSAGGGQVLLLNGTFALEQPVRITANETAGMRQLSIRAAHSGAASLSGGVRIAGWKPAEGRAGVWSAALPLALRGFGSSLPRFRQLFVDGVRANRTAFNATVRRYTCRTGHLLFGPLPRVSSCKPTCSKSSR